MQNKNESCTRPQNHKKTRKMNKKIAKVKNLNARQMKLEIVIHTIHSFTTLQFRKFKSKRPKKKKKTKKSDRFNY